MSLRGQVASGMFWTAVGQWGGQGMRFVVFLILARLLQPKDFGLLALGTVATEFASVIVRGGFPQALVQRDKLEDAHIDTAFWTGLGSSAVMFCIVFLSAPLFASYYEMPGLTAVLQWLSVGIIATAFSMTQVAVLTRELDFKVLAMRQNVAQVLGGAVGIVSALNGLGVWSLVLMTLVTSVSGSILLWVVSSWKPRFRYSLTHLRQLLGFGLQLVGAQLLVFLNRRVDELMVGSILGPVNLGYYHVGTRSIRMTAQMVSGVGSAVTFPVFSRIQGDLPKMRRGYLESTRLTSVVAFPLFLAFVAVADDLTLLLFGPKWLGAAPILRYFAIVGLFQSIQMFNGSVLLAMGKSAWRLYISAGTLFTTFATVLIAAPFGLRVLVIALAVRVTLFMPVMVQLIRRLLHISWWQYAVNLAPAAISSVTMLASVGLFQWAAGDQLSIVARFLLSAVVGSAVYVSSLYLIDRSAMKSVFEFALSVGKRAGGPATRARGALGDSPLNDEEPS